MDYKYIEQLLDKYWDCETSLEEEQILRCFFRQKEVPAHLCLTWRMRMMPLFKAAAVMAFLFTIGGVVKHSMNGERGGIVYVYDQFEHERQDPQVAYKADSLKTPIKNVPEKDMINKQ